LVLRSKEKREKFLGGKKGNTGEKKFMGLKFW